MIKKRFSEELLSYCCKECSKMTDKEIAQTSQLFSENYGKWSQKGYKPGKPIKFSKEKICQSFVNKPDRYVALVYYQDILVGHAFYLRRLVPQKGNITWILQLVVKEDFRGHSIGTKLMHSIWQLSDSYAWGLYTSNPITIKALENATMRKIEVKLINRKFKAIAPYLGDLLDYPWIESYCNGMVDTNFFIDHCNIKKNMAIAYPDEDNKFPLSTKLPEGYEWLALVFDEQKAEVSNVEQLEMYTQYSETNLIRAYSEMDMRNQAWSKHTENEADYLMNYIAPGSKVIDVGCGTGRLTNELAKRGAIVHGIDFSKKQISIGISNAQKNATFSCKDARQNFGFRKYNAAICMYDVIGSFPEEKDNIKILKGIYSCLKPGGIVVLSVMNMSLTKKNCAKYKNIIHNMTYDIDKLLKLKGTNTMQESGEVFDGRYIIVDDSCGICYRKEQFFLEDQLPLEYVIRDRRYTKKGITGLMQEIGFHIEESHYFQAGRIETELGLNSPKSKEILVIARKPQKRKGLNNIKGWK